MQSKLLKTERIIFKIIGASTANKRIRLMNNEQRKLLNELSLVTKDRYEQQLLKYFDFAGWARNIIEGRQKKPEFSKTPTISAD
jgi:hypothetical protein